MAFRTATLPWAWLIALVTFGAIESGMRTAIPADEFPVRQDIRASAAFLRVLKADGPAEIAFVGASLTERGVVIPRISKRVNAKARQTTRVANYGHPDAQAEFVEDVVHALMRGESKPRIVLYGVSPMQLNRDLRAESTSGVWRFEDLARKVQQRGPGVLDELPQVLQNELKLTLRIAQLRHDRKAWYQRLVNGRPFPKTGLRGGHYHITPGSRTNLIARPPTLKTKGYQNMKRRMQESIVDGHWVHSEKLLGHMKGVADLCRESGAELVYFEIPFHDTLRTLMADNTYDNFYDLMDEVSAETGFPFVSVSDLGVSLTDAHYADGAHLNLEGARTMSAPVTQHVVLPALNRAALRTQPRPGGP
jgi:hypothetical protein